jgi:3-deoxy-D-manno-octulosonate 8-phosphate phosphatase (KDO 8-P phosphatase)
MGNDMNDFDAMQYVGFSVAPANSHPDIIRIASLVLKKNGGDGAVRSLSELILKKTGEL